MGYIKSASEQSVLKMGKCDDLSDSDRTQIVMASDWVRSSPKWKVLWGFPGMQLLEPTKSGPKHDQWTGDRDIGAQGSLMHM